MAFGIGSGGGGGSRQNTGGSWLNALVRTVVNVVRTVATAATQYVINNNPDLFPNQSTGGGGSNSGGGGHSPSDAASWAAAQRAAEEQRTLDRQRETQLAEQKHQAMLDTLEIERDISYSSDFVGVGSSQQQYSNNSTSYAWQIWQNGLPEAPLLEWKDSFIQIHNYVAGNNLVTGVDTDVVYSFALSSGLSFSEITNYLHPTTLWRNQQDDDNPFNQMPPPFDPSTWLLSAGAINFFVEVQEEEPQLAPFPIRTWPPPRIEIVAEEEDPEEPEDEIQSPPQNEVEKSNPWKDLLTEILKRLARAGAEEIAERLIKRVVDEVEARISSSSVYIQSSSGDSTELDEVRTFDQVMIENKDGRGLAHPRNQRTSEEWAIENIYDQGSRAITSIENPATISTRPEHPNDIVPLWEEIKNIRTYEFHVLADTEQVRQAVNSQIERLQLEHPNWTIRVVYGNNTS